MPFTFQVGFPLSYFSCLLTMSLIILIFSHLSQYCVILNFFVTFVCHITFNKLFLSLLKGSVVSDSTPTIGAVCDVIDQTLVDLTELPEEADLLSKDPCGQWASRRPGDRHWKADRPSSRPFLEIPLSKSRSKCWWMGLGLR